MWLRGTGAYSKTVTTTNTCIKLTDDGEFPAANPLLTRLSKWTHVRRSLIECARDMARPSNSCRRHDHARQHRLHLRACSAKLSHGELVRHWKDCFSDHTSLTTAGRKRTIARRYSVLHNICPRSRCERERLDTSPALSALLRSQAVSISVRPDHPTRPPGHRPSLTTMPFYLFSSVYSLTIVFLGTA
jgi:hypothetical protein